MCFDMAKAFDTVPHSLLLNKLKCNKLPLWFTAWCNDFLANRTQMVKVNKSLSDKMDITSGVLQGSVIGPALFGFYVGDFKTRTCYSNVVKYADDFSFIISIPRGADINNIISNEIQNFSSWCNCNGLRINSDKTKLIYFSGRNKKRYPIDTCIGGVRTVNSINILGVNIDCELNWKLHINSLIKTGGRLIGVLRRLKSYGITSKCLTMVYNGLIESRLLYGCSIYAGAGITLLKQLEKVKSRAHKVICGRLCNNNLCTLSTSFGDNIDNFSINTFHKISRGNSVLSTFIPLKLKHTQKWNSVYHKTNIRGNSFFIRIPRILNKQLVS